ncbi:hypothetical protein Tco_1233852, partial [Tanacetum coccineum]
GELAHNDLIPSGINETDFDLEEDIHFIERLLYDNSFPRPPKAFKANSNTIIDSFPTFPILVEDSDSLREEIDIFSSPDDSIPPGIKSDDFDSEDDDNSTFLLEFESFYPDSGDSTIDVVEDIPVDVPNILPFIWISNSFLLLMISDLILMILLLPEIETRFTIWGYALKSNPRDFLLLFPPMSRIFEASRARGICPSITRASQSSASFGNPDILILSTNVYTS